MLTLDVTRCKKDCSSVFFFTTLATFTKFYSDGHHWEFGSVLFYAENSAFGKIVLKIMATALVVVGMVSSYLLVNFLIRALAGLSIDGISKAGKDHHEKVHQ